MAAQSFSIEYIENFRLKFVNSSGTALQGVVGTVTIQGETYNFTSDINGFSEFYLVLETGSQLINITVDASTEFNPTTDSYTHKGGILEQYNVIVGQKVSAELANQNNFIRWYKITGDITLQQLIDAGGITEKDNT